MAKSPDSIKYYDGLFDFELGMDSGVQPLLLNRNQAAFITNGTVRQTFISPRPSYRKMNLDFGGNTTLQANVETRLWQGGCFYNPDFGNQGLMAAIAGRLFQFSIAGNTATVTDRTIPGDPNPATPVQAWLWQSENYIIWNDGLSLPVFFDGSTSRRSYGAQVVLATISVNYVVPAVGSSVVVTLTAPYTGPLNVPVRIGSAFYQTVGAGAVYNATLTNYSDTPAATVPAATQVVAQPSVLGVVQTAFPVPGLNNYPVGTLLPLTLTLPYTGSIGDQFNMFGGTWQVFGISGAVISVKPITAVTDPTGSQVPFGAIVQSATSSAPNVVVANTAGPFVVPAIGSTVAVTLTAPYLGTANQAVFLNGKQYTIAAAPSPPPGASLTIINNTDTPGATVTAPIDILSVPELPAGRMGVYGMGRNWVCLVDGKSFIASDIVGGSSGTKANQFRDAPLKITENTYLSGGGVFQVPGSIGDIRAMRFTATLDTSMGQGALQVFTPSTVFSCNAPVDRTTWQSLTNPILTISMLANGAQGQNSTIPVNGDTFFRATDGIRSLILGQRQFSTWGNVPLSLEVDRIVNDDNAALLNYGSAVVFNNRMIMTAAPVAGPQGVFHEAAVVLNFDPIRSVDEKTQPVYDGMWTGVNVLQYIGGTVAGVDRLFAFTYNVPLKKIELYEVLLDGQSDFDNDVIPIVWSFETASLFKELKGKGPFDLIRLEDGEIYVDDVIGRVDFRVFYKPDQYPCWTPWFQWSICAAKQNPLSPDPADADLKPQYRPRMGLGKPSADDCDNNTGFPLREGSTFQFKFVITGHCRFLGAKFMATSLPDVLFAKPVCDPICP